MLCQVNLLGQEVVLGLSYRVSQTKCDTYFPLYLCPYECVIKDLSSTQLTNLMTSDYKLLDQ